MVKKNFLLFTLALLGVATTAFAKTPTIALESSVVDKWEQLQHTSSAKLTDLKSKTGDAQQLAWIQLALISKRFSLNKEQLSHELLSWREHNPSHPANQLLPDNSALNTLKSASLPQHIAILIPEHGVFETSGKIFREGFLNAYYSNLSKVGKQSIKFYDTTQANNINTVYQQAISDGADFVIGPLLKENVQRLIKSSSFHVPTLALNYTGRSTLPANFFEFGLLPEDEAKQIADRARQNGLARAIIIAPQNDWGKRMVAAFSTRWTNHNGTIQAKWFYTAEANFSTEMANLLRVNLNLDSKLIQLYNEKKQLDKLRRHDFDVIFLFAQPQEARLIVPLLKFYYVNDIPVYATSTVYSGKPSPGKDADLNGIIVCDIPWSKQMPNRSSHDNLQTDRLYAVGQDAYLLSLGWQHLSQLPYFPIYGTTGALTLSQQQIHRRVPCTAVRNGRL